MLKTMLNVLKVNNTYIRTTLTDVVLVSWLFTLNKSAKYSKTPMFSKSPAKKHQSNTKNTGIILTQYLPDFLNFFPTSVRLFVQELILTIRKYLKSVCSHKGEGPENTKILKDRRQFPLQILSEFN